MVFLHGTAIMHASAEGRPRAERVQQSVRRDPEVLDFAAYVPTDGAVEKVRAWERAGAEICYLSSHRTAAAAAVDGAVLKLHGFPDGTVHFRAGDEGYAGVASRAGVDVLVEDDCESIGGAAETTAAALTGAADHAIKCVVVPEFGGLAHLPDDPRHLADQALSRAIP
jgi:hypothetical protein